MAHASSEISITDASDSTTIARSASQTTNPVRTEDGGFSVACYSNGKVCTYVIPDPNSLVVSFTYSDWPIFSSLQRDFRRALYLNESIEDKIDKTVIMQIRLFILFNIQNGLSSTSVSSLSFQCGLKRVKGLRCSYPCRLSAPNSLLKVPLLITGAKMMMVLASFSRAGRCHLPRSGLI